MSCERYAFAAADFTGVFGSLSQGLIDRHGVPPRSALWVWDWHDCDMWDADGDRDR
jgi:hypothetical protein